MRVSALPTIASALITALKGDASLAALIGTRVYQGRAPASVAAPYITILTPSENADNVFGRGGTLNAEQVHVWAANDQAVRVIAGHVSRILANDTLYVGGGFDVVARDINLVTILRDPDNGLSHGVMRFLTRLSQWPDWPGVWEPTADTVLFAEAHGQVTSSQIVRSRIGPDGWLGDSPTTPTNDPTYASDPARWVFDTMAGRIIDWGDNEIIRDAMNDPEGFTMAIALDVIPVASPNVIVFFHNYLQQAGPDIYGPWAELLDVSGEYNIAINVHYDGTVADLDFVRSDVRVAQTGQYVLGFHLDRAHPRSSARYQWFINGAAVSTTMTFTQGTAADDAPVSVPGAPVRIGPFTPWLSQEAGYGIAIARGVMGADWHAGFYAHAQARGWV